MNVSKCREYDPHFCYCISCDQLYIVRSSWQYVLWWEVNHCIAGENLSADIPFISLNFLYEALKLNVFFYLRKLRYNLSTEKYTLIQVHAVYDQRHNQDIEPLIPSTPKFPPVTLWSALPPTSAPDNHWQQQTNFLKGTVLSIPGWPLLWNLITL